MLADALANVVLRYNMEHPHLSLSDLLKTVEWFHYIVRALVVDKPA